MTLTVERRRALFGKIMKMKEAATSFYMNAQRIGIHPFLELTGIMNEQIKMYEAMFKEGRDFELEELEGPAYHFAYIGEKLGCIYGSALLDEPNRAALLHSMMGAEGV